MGPGWLEHLLEHPEIVLEASITRPTFHICTRHPVARATLASGRIPADFACPLDPTAGPMRRFLDAAPGRSLRLSGVPEDVPHVVAIPTAVGGDQ